MTPTKTSGENDLFIKKAEEVREREHRLTPSLRLRTLPDIVQFVHAKGLVSMLGGNELPSMISAVLGKPWKSSAKGFTAWKEWWSLKIEDQRLSNVLAELERRDDILASRIFRRSKTLVSNTIWPILNPIIEHHKNLAIREKLVPPLELKLLDTIESEGSIRTDRLRKKLRLEDRENNYRFHRSLGSLESQGLIVGAEDPNPERHLHANIWQTWEKRTRNAKKLAGASYGEMVAKLFEKTLDACVLAREAKVPEWYVWSNDIQDAKEKLLKKGIIVRSGAFLIPFRIFDRS